MKIKRVNEEGVLEKGDCPLLSKREPIYGGGFETRKVLCHGLTFLDPRFCQSEATMSTFEGILAIDFAL